MSENSPQITSRAVSKVAVTEEDNSQTMAAASGTTAEPKSADAYKRTQTILAYRVKGILSLREIIVKLGADQAEWKKNQAKGI